MPHMCQNVKLYLGWIYLGNCSVGTMAADNMVTQGARASAAMVLAKLSRNIPDSTHESCYFVCNSALKWVILYNVVDMSMNFITQRLCFQHLPTREVGTTWRRNVMGTLSHYWPFVRGVILWRIHRRWILHKWPAMWTLMWLLSWVWTSCWTNSPIVGDL